MALTEAEQLWCDVRRAAYVAARQAMDEGLNLLNELEAAANNQYTTVTAADKQRAIAGHIAKRDAALAVAALIP